MDTRSTIIISGLSLIIGIGIGRFTATASHEANMPAQGAPAVAHTAQSAPANTQAKLPTQAPANGTELAAAAKTAFGNHKDNQPAATTTPDTSPLNVPASNNPNNIHDDSAESAAKRYPNEITAEEIDRVLPAPFNESFKRNHGFLREKYKDFVANTQPNDWDTRMQNKMTDFIFSNPYAKFLTVESLLCKSGLCEIRVFETKEGSWGLILSEMQLQDWWDIGGYHSAGNGVGDGRMAYHVLLPRKKVTPST